MMCGRKEYKTESERRETKEEDALREKILKGTHEVHSTSFGPYAENLIDYIIRFQQ